MNWIGMGRSSQRWRSRSMCANALTSPCVGQAVGLLSRPRKARPQGVVSKKVPAGQRKQRSVGQYCRAAADGDPSAPYRRTSTGSWIRVARRRSEGIDVPTVAISRLEAPNPDPTYGRPSALARLDGRVLAEITPE